MFFAQLQHIILHRQNTLCVKIVIPKYVCHWHTHFKMDGKNTQKVKDSNTRSLNHSHVSLVWLWTRIMKSSAKVITFK